MEGSLLVVGTGSNVGKSTVVAGLLRLLARRGVRAAPFKGQNMALNAAVVEGGEIGRAQALQARAARIVASVDMNPVLLKPTGPGRSQLVVLGKARGELEASRWLSDRRGLRDEVLAAFDRLRAEVDVVIAEGAGSCAEINLLEADLANLALAQARGLPAVLLGDIDRGGVFASIYGHYRVLPPELAAHLRGFVITKFRGEPSLLAPGIRELEQRLGTRGFGVVPWAPIALPAEDSLVRWAPSAGVGPRPLRIAIVELPHLANATDFDPLFAEGHAVRWVRSPAELADDDLVVVPGSKATVADLRWLRSRGFGPALAAHRDRGGWLLGICAGYQMFARVIDDPVESRVGRTEGLGFLDATVRFEGDKVTRRVEGELRWPASERIVGYLMHHGRVRSDEEPLVLLDAGTPEGSRHGRVLATSVHGLFDEDAARWSLLGTIAEDRGRELAARVSHQARIEAAIDEVADLLEQHVDLEALFALLGEVTSGRVGPPRVAYQPPA